MKGNILMNCIYFTYRIHTEPNVNNYICEVCNKTFAVKTYYEQHKLLHQTKATTEEVSSELKKFPLIKKN